RLQRCYARTPARVWALQRNHIVEIALLCAGRGSRHPDYQQACRALPDRTHRRTGGGLMSCLYATDRAERLSREVESICRTYLSYGPTQGLYWQVGDVRTGGGRSMFVRLHDRAAGPAG